MIIPVGPISAQERVLLRKRVYLDFDGVMATPTIYVNGQKAGQTNVVAVHVDTRL